MKTLLAISPALLGIFVLTGPARAAAPDAGMAFFEAKIRPVLVEHCYSCHSAAAKKSKGELQLDTKASLLKGGENGPVVVPGKPEQSLLVKALRHAGDHKMPPKGKLSDSIVADFVKWIELGAPDPRDGAATVALDWEAARKFWSFQPVKKPTVPAVNDAGWPANDIDRFILARLEEKGLRPVTSADKRTLLRRATLDLTGLPPTPEEIDAFLKDETPDAFARVVDRLLASPHYGERWGRYWLDVARYAEDQAHTFGVQPYTEAWRYRDWVIDALNADMPYDRFVKLQIAADLLDDGSPAFIKERAALGFFGLGAQYYKGNDKVVAEELDDRVDTLGRGMLGLTVSCARCHDHKFDPIPTQDYYSLAGVFFSTKLSNVPLAPKVEVDRFQEGQKQVQEADKKLKEFIRTEKARVAEARAADIAAYMVAARKVQARRMEKPNYSAAEQAKVDKLNPAFLDRWVKYLEPKNATVQKVAALESWRKLPMPPKGAPEVGPDVLQTAKAFQDHVQSLLQKKEPPKDKKPEADKTKAELLQGLFGDKGVFAVADNELMAQLPPERKQQMQAMQGQLEKVKKEAPPAPPSAHAISEASPADMKVFVRGDPKQQGEVAPRRFLRVLSTTEPTRFSKGSGRIELADAIASKDNPLTARVLVNRLWQHHFGRGIVGTPSNFGQLGERPTHPELLDHLAARFVEGGWSMKKIHREIMLSRTYRMASAAGTMTSEKDPQLVDPDNRLLWRMNRRRLDVEPWRDSLLAVAGELDRSFGGKTTDLGNDQNRRRTVYAKISRHELNGLLRLFDFPDANLTSENRTETTVPQQQLFVLNGPFFVARAKVLAARLKKEPGDDAAHVRQTYLLAYGRPASDAEVAVASRYLSAKDAPEEASKNQLSRWERYCQAILAGNEFLYID